MTSKLLTILLSFLSFTTLAQKNSKVIIIDTIEGPLQIIKIAAINKENTQFDELDAMNIHDTGNGYNILSVDLSKTRQCRISAIIHFRNASDLLKLPIDDSGGELTIHNAFLLQSDTIHFTKLTVFHNCFPDSIFNSSSWYKRIRQDTLDTLIHLKHSYSEKIRNKDCNPFYPKSIVSIINNVSYTSDLNKVQSGGEIAHYHGIPKMTKRRRRKYEDDILSGNPYKYFHGSRVTKRYCLNVEIKM